VEFGPLLPPATEHYQIFNQPLILLPLQNGVDHDFQARGSQVGDAPPATATDLQPAVL